MIIPRYYENLKVLHENTMPNRSYYIPASERKKDLVEDRTLSDRMVLLNGKWDFCYYESIYDLQEEFYREDYVKTPGWGVISVPSVWQMEGYDHHQYTNVRYPYPLDPPYVPQDNPCGVYRHRFYWKADALAPKTYLNFEGVDSCFYVWLNGHYVGYSQVSHSTSEFEVSGYLREGENLLAVLVLKWCDGSYLEDQDKFRMSGIFRDVYLLRRPAEGIFDYFIKTKLSPDRQNAQVEIEFSYFHEPVPVRVSVEDADERTLAVAEGSGKVVLPLKNIRLWSAETPYLYTVILEAGGEVIADALGLRDIAIDKGVLYFNGQNIKLHGVNRHDSDPKTGFAISLAKMHRDLRLMKEHNVNAIRTSHYPNAPQFLQLCDRYGFYVIDEADVESHGTNHALKQEWTDSCRWTANNPDFVEATVDRVQRCVIRDKNRPCVFAWSMGNEASYGCTFEAALKWTKEYDDTRVTHYENAAHHSEGQECDFSNLDLYSRMYPSPEAIREYFKQEVDAAEAGRRYDVPGVRPYILCEYSHAMGNGPGNLEDYFRVFQEFDGACGGMVWEWCDHAVDKGETKDGRKIYYYGGDHGEFPHDGNFCMDGLVYPDRRPHTGLLEFANVYRPARVMAFDAEAGKLRIHNYMDFVNLKDYCKIVWNVNCDGVIAEAGEIPAEALDIAPHKEGEVLLPLSVPEEGRCYLKVNWILKENAGILPAGYSLGFDEIDLAPGRQCLRAGELLFRPLKKAPSADDFAVTQDDRYLTVETADFRYVYNKLTGLFVSLVYLNRSLLDRPMEFNVWRAPTDNDRNIRRTWQMAHYDSSYARAYSTEYYKKEEEGRTCLVIESDTSLTSLYIQKAMDIHAVWTIWQDGSIDARLEVKKDPVFPRLPRFGVRLILPKCMNRVDYYGLGPMESYADKRRASYHSHFCTTVEAMHEDYIFPQENGSHFDTDFVELSGPQFKLAAVSQKPFSFNASHYTQEELTEKMHNYELEESGHTVLCIDYKQDGIGSNSCGPEPELPYQFLENEFTFCFGLRMEKCTEGHGC